MSSNNVENITQAKVLSRSRYIALTILLSIAMSGALSVFLLVFIYTITMTLATSSAMIFFILFGVATFALALYMLCFIGISSVRKKYGLKPLLSETAKPNAKSSLNPPKEKATISAVFRLTNFVIFVVGVLSIVISAALGAISSNGWTREFYSYREENGYYGVTKKIELGFVPKDNLKIELDTKNAVIIYDENITEIMFVFYNEFEKQVHIIQTENAQTVTETKPPDISGALEKMMFFVFLSSKTEKQIK
ncbi:MAG TPA: hypothetical protein VJZ69_03990, partial [Clostridia bacterium]|nr:hypothetical protein [Clostridia bacterium]